GAVGAERQGAYRPEVTAKLTDELAVGSIPETDHAVVVAGGGKLRAGRECQRRNPRFLGNHDATPAAQEVPQNQVERCAGQHLPIGPEAPRRLVFVQGFPAELTSGSRVPLAESASLLDGPKSTWAKRHGHHVRVGPIGYFPEDAARGP